jgi:hypothetical protein
MTTKKSFFFFNVFTICAVSVALTSYAETEAALGTSARTESSGEVVTAPTVRQAELLVAVTKGVVGQVFVLDGSKSQDDGVIRKFMWQQVSGPIVSLSSTSSLKPTFAPKVAGTYVFELIVTDSVGNTSTVQKNEFTVGNDAPAVKMATSTSHGDPDFDLKTVSSPTSLGDMDRDGRDDKKALSGTSTDHAKDSDASAGKAEITGDPDFDLLNIQIGGEDLDSFRTEVSTGGSNKKVTVRGWNPEKKEEIVAHPESVKTSDELKTYVEAVALRDEALTNVQIKKDTIEVESREKGKLLWLFPVEMTSRVVVSFKLKDSTADQVSVRLPWWHIFVAKRYTSSDIETDISAGLNASVWQKVDNSEVSVDTVTHVSQVLETVSNVLKTRHDTVKNSISNVR